MPFFFLVMKAILLELLKGLIPVSSNAKDLQIVCIILDGKTTDHPTQSHSRHSSESKPQAASNCIKPGTKILADTTPNNPHWGRLTEWVNTALSCSCSPICYEGNCSNYMLNIELMCSLLKSSHESICISMIKKVFNIH